MEFYVKDIPFKSLRTGEKLKSGSLEIRPVHVDRSVPSEHKFVINTRPDTLVYAGDFRIHSLLGMTLGFVYRISAVEPAAVVTGDTIARTI